MKQFHRCTQYCLRIFLLLASPLLSSFFPDMPHAAPTTPAQGFIMDTAPWQQWADQGHRARMPGRYRVSGGRALCLEPRLWPRPPYPSPQIFRHGGFPQ